MTKTVKLNSILVAVDYFWFIFRFGFSEIAEIDGVIVFK